jgi:hypothetical protein
VPGQFGVAGGAHGLRAAVGAAQQAMACCRFYSFRFICVK